MSIFAIGDLHLSLGSEKPMDIFGGWHDYVQRIYDNWNNTITDNDIVVLAGDISWAMKLSECVKDFEFINNLPGKKLILKGNHDYWWCTMSKMVAFLQSNRFDTISFLHNNAYIYGDKALCGTRGWLLEDNALYNDKIALREEGRLEASLKEGEGYEKICFLHYPPIFKNQSSKNMLDLLNKYDVKTCYYGHLHGSGIPYAVQGNVNGVFYKLISADALSFSPYKIC